MMHRKDSPSHTRNISPKLGLLGFLGILGFTGFLPQILSLSDSADAQPFFMFFAFFGFFGFYYEGNMSGTFIDERFETNSFRASAIANRTALSLIILTAILMISVFRFSPSTMLSILFAVIGLAFGLSTFLQQYLLYRFDCGE